MGGHEGDTDERLFAERNDGKRLCRRQLPRGGDEGNGKTLGYKDKRLSSGRTDTSFGALSEI